MPEKPEPAGQDGRHEAPTAGSDDQTVRSADAPERRLAGRRARELGPPGPERRRQRRRASDAPKPPCPWCGSCTSSVYRSLGRLASRHAPDRYRRRRQCADCGRDWPTLEVLDLQLFAREVAAHGLTLADLGVGPGGADKLTEGQRRAPDGDTRPE